MRVQFRLDWRGLHGFGHWARVCERGLGLAARRGADPLLVELFAYLHDSQRESDGDDRGHGERAAAYAAALNTSFFDLGVTDLDRLCRAIRFHSDGLMEADSTLQTCWDADRLDLGRVGHQPSSRLLSPEAAALVDRALSETVFYDPTQDPTEPWRGG
ncbi:MAG: hypothetical protein HZC25_06335 [Rhodospirillales bacterium]|nr:hypothetical protein [Rhodospirillales bacterium]